MYTTMIKSNCNIKLQENGAAPMRDEFCPSPLSSSCEHDLGGSNPDSFPLILYNIVSDESCDDCIHWLPDGSHFTIANKEKFSRTILPAYFGSRGSIKFTSFTRRLKRWKFTRISKGPHAGAYCHEYFVKDKPELLGKIVYPGDMKTISPSSSKSIPKVKSANKVRRRVSTGSLLQPVVDPFDVTVTSVSNPVLDMFDLSPMPLSLTETPKMTEDITNWLSDTEFNNGDNSDSNHMALCLSSPTAGAASVVSESSQLTPLPLANSITEPAIIAGLQRSKPLLVTRRHSCIASINSSSSYNVPLNDVGIMASKNADIGIMSATGFNQPQTTPSYDHLVTNQMQQMVKQPLMHFVGGSASHVEPLVNQVNQNIQEQHSVQQQSSYEVPTAELRCQQEKQVKDQEQAQSNEFLDQLDDLFRFSNDFSVEDFLNETR